MTSQQLLTIADMYTTKLIELGAPSQSMRSWTLAELKIISEKCKSLQVIDISNRYTIGYQLGEQVLETLITTLPNLKDISFTGFLGEKSKAKQQCLKLGIRLQH